MFRRSPCKHNFLLAEDYDRANASAVRQADGKSVPRTLIPLPALQTVDFISMNDHSIDLVVVDILKWPPSLRTEGFLRVAQDQVDLPGNGFCRLGVITYVSMIG